SCGFKRRVELLDRAEGFAQLLAQTTGRPGERLQYLLLALGLLLVARQHVARPPIDRLEQDHIIAAKRSNPAGDERLQSLALAYFAPDLNCHPVIFRPPHQPQRLTHPNVGKQMQKGRLTELHRESLLERSVKDWIPGRVDEVGEQDRVL